MNDFASAAETAETTFLPQSLPRFAERSDESHYYREGNHNSAAQ